MGLSTLEQCMTPEILLAQFREEIIAASGTAVIPVPFVIETQSVSKEKRTVSGVASVEQISRSGLLVRIKGLDIRVYNEMNPVVLASHCSITSDLMPGAIGTVEKVSKRGNALLFKNMHFDTDPLAQAWWEKIESGTIRMVSIGFAPLEWEIGEEEIDGKATRYIEVLKSELLEISPVAIGANQGAYINNGRRETLSATVEQLRREIELLKAIVEGVDETDGESWGNASWPDACFIIERGAPKEKGRTVHKYRHLPHHKSSAKSPTDNGSVDIPHLRNALARVNQVKPVKESATAYRARATSHLRTHARALLESHKDEMLSLVAVLDENPDPDAAKFETLRDGLRDIQGMVSTTSKV